MIRGNTRMLLFLVIAVAAAGLFALLMTATPSLEPSEPQKLSPSVEPKVTWSPTSVEVILSPGESTVKNFTFTSDKPLENVIIEPVPELAGLLTVVPTTIAAVPANAPQAFTVSFAIPQDASLGTFDGTIHVRIGDQTLPQTLKVVVNAWQPFTDASLGLQFKYPPDWTITRDSDTISFFPAGSSPDESLEYTGEVTIFIDHNALQLTPEQYYDGTNNQNFFADSQAIKYLTINGRPSIKFDGLIQAIVPTAVVVIVFPEYFIRLEAVGSLPTFDRLYNSILPM